MLRAFALVSCAIVCAMPAPAAADGSRSGRIDAARERMNDNREDDSHDTDDSSGEIDWDDDDCWDCEDDEGGDSAIGNWLAYHLFGGPFVAPALIVGDWYPLRRFRFLAYPYHDGRDGQHRFLALDEQGRPTEPEPVEMSLRVLASYERHDANLDGRRLRVTLRSNSRFNLDASITRYTEVLGPGDVDHLWHSKALVTYSFAVSPHAAFSAGLGARNMYFGTGDQFTHFALRYGFELFPVRPLHAWVLGEAGLGPSGGSTEVEAGVGVIIHRFELFAGYRRFRVVGVDFAGPELGALAWF